MEDFPAQVLKIISDCVNGVNRFLDTSVLPECKRFIVVLYSAGFFLFLLRLYLGQPFSQVLQAQYPQPEGFILPNEEEVLTPGIHTCLRLISTVFTLFTNLMPLFFPFMISGFANRMRTANVTFTF